MSTCIAIFLYCRHLFDYPTLYADLSYLACFRNCPSRSCISRRPVFCIETVVMSGGKSDSRETGDRVIRVRYACKQSKVSGPRKRQIREIITEVEKN